MIRRPPLSLSHPDAVPALAATLRGDPVGSVRRPGALVDAALAHGMGGYLADAVQDGRAVLPDSERQRLGRAQALRAARSALLLRELGPILRTVERATGSAAVCVKGPAVRRLHSLPGARTFADLDLVVPRHALGTASAALCTDGWTVRQEFTSGFAAEHGHDVHLERRRAGLRIDVELHWRIGDDPATAALDHALLSRGAVTVQAGGAVPAPAPEAELLVLAVHLLSDREKRLVWVADLTLAAQALDADRWHRAFVLADRIGLAWVLHRALDYGARHLGLQRTRPIPAGPALPWGPLRAVDELDMRGSVHIGRLAAMGWRRRGRYLRAVLLPDRAGLEATVGGDGAPTWRLVARHARTALAAVLPRRG